MKKQFKFSVIIPIYNVEEYLEETIESVINQTIGFKDNIELILINDGSPDNSEEICLKYKELYPENVIYYKQKNAGVSAARNKGIELATGELINFLDSDDKWSLNALKEGAKILDRNPEVMSVIYPLKYFDAKEGEHFLNIVFKEGKKIFNVIDEYQNLKLQCCSIIFRREIIKDHRFSDKLKISEDARFLCEIFMDYPIVAKAKSYYLYRKRANETSAIQNSSKKKTWYLDTPKYSYLHLIQLSKEKFKKVIYYIQYYILYEIKWRINVDSSIALNKNEKTEYYNLLKTCLNEISNDFIINFPFFNDKEKLFVLSLKYSNTSMYSLKDELLYIENSPICSISECPVYIDNIFEYDNNLEIYGRYPTINNIIENIEFKDNFGEIYPIEKYDLNEKTKCIYSLSPELNFKYSGFHCKIKLEDKNKEIRLVGIGDNEFNINLMFSYNSSLNNHFNGIYLRTEKNYVYQRNNKIIIEKKNILRKLALEVNCDLKLLVRKKIKSYLYRKLAGVYRLFKRKEIWIISDRILVANDNGEAFFEYLNTIENNKIKVYFVISPESKDYERLKNKYTNVIKHRSLKHKILHLNSDKIISAQADDYVTNLFGRSKYYIADLYRFKFIFLQHGIIYNDLSSWLNINNKKIDLFITSSMDEYNSIVGSKYKYNYSKECVKLTGLARYDKLYNNNYTLKKQIVIIPTWRKYLVSSIDVKTGKRIFNKDIKTTEFYKNYNNLLNNDELLKFLSENNYKIKFIPHANMQEQVKFFDKNELVEIESNSINFCQEFSENSILITDYSSVFFDFAYLKKPIIYFQFDKDEFYQGQIYDKGYFIHEKDGFGKVTYTINDVIEEIERIIKNDCILDEKYKKRIEKFYKFYDANNCKRIYDEIIKMK